jgi:hypothetical protein
MQVEKFYPRPLGGTDFIACIVCGRRTDHNCDLESLLTIKEEGERLVKILGEAGCMSFPSVSPRGDHYRLCIGGACAKHHRNAARLQKLGAQSSFLTIDMVRWAIDKASVSKSSRDAIELFVKITNQIERRLERMLKQTEDKADMESRRKEGFAQANKERLAAKGVLLYALLDASAEKPDKDN